MGESLTVLSLSAADSEGHLYEQLYSGGTPPVAEIDHVDPELEFDFISVDDFLCRPAGWST